MADIPVSLGGIDKTGRAARSMAKNFRGAAQKSQGSFRKLGAVGGKAIRGIGTAVKGVGIALGALAVAGAAAFGATLKGAVDSAAEVEKFTESLGISSNEVQVWRTALENTGEDLGTLQGAITGTSDFLQELANGEQDAADAADLLGISMEDLQGKTPDQQLLQVGSALAQMEDRQTAVALGNQIMGEDFIRLLPIFADFEDSLQSAEEQTQLLSEEQINTAGIVRETTGQIGQAFHGLALDAATSFFDMLTANSEAISGILMRLDGFLTWASNDFQGLTRLLVSPFLIFREQVEIQLANIQIRLIGFVRDAVKLFNRIPGVNIQTPNLDDRYFEQINRRASAQARGTELQANLDRTREQRDAAIQQTVDEGGGALTNIFEGLLGQIQGRTFDGSAVQSTFTATNEAEKAREAELAASKAEEAAARERQKQARLAEAEAKRVAASVRTIGDLLEDSERTVSEQEKKLAQVRATGDAGAIQEAEAAYQAGLIAINTLKEQLQIAESTTSSEIAQEAVYQARRAIKALSNAGKDLNSALKIGAAAQREAEKLAKAAEAEEKRRAREASTGTRATGTRPAGAVSGGGGVGVINNNINQYFYGTILGEGFENRVIQFLDEQIRRGQVPSLAGFGV